MKSIVLLTRMVMFFLCGQSAFAATGQLFNVSAGFQPTLFRGPGSTITLTINTTIPNKTYNVAGIQITSLGYALQNPDSGCTPLSNGYCLFSVSNSIPAQINVTTPIYNIMSTPLFYKLTMKLCLNGTGEPLSCEMHTVSPISPPGIL